ncbi:MAG: hypothetical protein PHU25_03955 [Deltaproteobacteria bacterium]|nr:hypothetical protein [Deltaproteobacteria bacterium]
MRRFALLLAALLVPATALAADDLRRTPGVLFALEGGGDLLFALGAEARTQPSFTGAIAFGYRLRDVEVMAVGRVEEDLAAAGLEAMWRMPCFAPLLVGGGVHYAVSGSSDRGLELVLPRVDLRLPLSPSWELSWTLLRLSYFDGTMIDDEWDRGHRRLALGSSIGLEARADRIWERPRPKPLASGILLRFAHAVALFTPAANERAEQVVAGDDRMGRGFPESGFAFLEIAPGYRFSLDLGWLELGLPIAVYPLQALGGVGLTVLFRPRSAPALGLGLTAAWYPRNYLLLYLPRIELSWRVTDAFDLSVTPLAFALLVQPARDVWVEEGLESKVPFVGLAVGLGMGWSLPAP